MQSFRNRKYLLFLLCLLVISLGCINMPGDIVPWQAADQELQAAAEDACNATAYIEITHEITLQETNQFGTRACEYTLQIKNMHPDSAISVVFYQHDKDGYANTENSHWMGNSHIKPGENAEWNASVYLYTDPDANGPLMSIPEKIAGVYDIPECSDETQDETYFDKIAVPVTPVCPME